MIGPRRAPRTFAALLAVVASACAPDATHPEAPESAAAPSIVLPGALVDAAWLERNLGDPRLVVVDTRPPEEHAAGHVPGAVSLTPGDLLDPDPANARNLGPIPLVERVAGAAGIDMERVVVLYDAGADYRAAARVFWVLETHGHPAVAVLNGGLPGWIEAGGGLESGPVEPAARRFVAEMRPERLATQLGVMRAVDDPRTTILDSRSLDEFAGRVSKAERSGHIPTSVHVDAAANLASDGDGVCGVRSIDGLAELYAGVDLGDKVITYCNSGNRASVSYLALRALGRDVAVYDGSWMEWGNDPALPIESGASGGSGLR